MIRGQVQCLRYDSAATRLWHTVTDDSGRRRKPDGTVSLALYDPAGSELVSGTALTKAELDCGDYCDNLDTVLEFNTAGASGEDWRVVVFEGGACAVIVASDINVLGVTYDDGVTTVADLEAAITALAGADDVVDVKTAGTGANVLVEPDDSFVPVRMTLDASMSEQAVDEHEGFLDYDTQTVEFSIGAILTGGTSDATARILGDYRDGDSGTLHLLKIDGAFTDGETITDSEGGTAKADGTLYSCVYYYDVDTTDTDSYDVSTNYYAVISYAIDGVDYERLVYFDIGLSPMTAPVVTSADVDALRPVWVASRPRSWADWTPAIEKAHADLVRRIQSRGEEAAQYVRRDEEFWSIEFAFVEAEIARACGFAPEILKRLEDEAEQAWASRGMLTAVTDDEAEVTTGKETIESSFGR